MPRAARKTSPVSIYHVIQRGVAQQDIFEDDADRERYLGLLERFGGFGCYGDSDNVLFAWCLMSNHVHLLVRMDLAELSLMMQKIGAAYVRYFNDRYERIGHLFQDRFKSEPVCDDAYLLTVVRYIHQNPAKAGLGDAASYTWSSYRAYADSSNAHAAEITDTHLVMDMLGGRDAFEQYHREDSSADACMDAYPDSSRPKTDEAARALASQVLGGDDVQTLASMPKTQRDDRLVRLREAGLSVRQIARITGLGTNIVARAQHY